MTKPRRRLERKVVVHDKMQKKYVYMLIAPMGKSFDPRFKPGLTPKQMLQLGVFGVKYMTDCQKEFPSDWFTKAKLPPKKHDASLNYFKVDASQPLRVWQKKGWIHPDDPRGWFQWYCRYYMGRRHVKTDQTMGCDKTSHYADQKELQEGRCHVSSTAKTGGFALGV